ncbi:MAG: hypothetical protein H9897_00865 [Candidatus Ureaplasma intestinipullorum]|uniref:Uncharacterized protein n=1 Tax=Candidatus Ureaplasma intestinipullorum TaxID=2838770 RepID=A0A9E2NVR9_9BACT|nr:hypothetical protein [Candidatus Ureaplasma intestinipullorum]
MLKIIKNNINIDLDYNGIKILQSNNSNLFYKDVILDSSIYIDDYKIKNENIIYINNFSQLKDFMNLTKKSNIFLRIIELLFEYKIINYENINQIINIINNEYQYELLEINEGDNSKLISMFFELLNNKYLDQNLLEIILNNVFDDKKLIILDNIEWINLEFLSKFLNQHYFLVLTNNFEKYIQNYKELEILTIIKNNYDYFDVLDINHLCVYLQSELNINIDHNNIVELLHKNDINSQFILWKLNNI